MKTILPPIFIVGCGHSGTTIMLRILSAHSKIYGVAEETNLFTQRGRKFNNFLINVNKETVKSGKTMWVEKTPKHIGHISKIFKKFPGARVIVMIRNGLDVFASIKTRVGAGLAVSRGLNRWIADNNSALRFKDDENVKFVKLEELQRNPSIVLNDIVQFVGLEYEKTMLDYHMNGDNRMSKIYAGKVVKEESLGAKGMHTYRRNWQINQPLFRNTSRWKKDLSEKEKNIFFNNKDALRLMKHYCYEIENDS